MKPYKSFREALDDPNKPKEKIDIQSEISGIQDSIKKLQNQNANDQIDIKYVKKDDPEYNQKRQEIQDKIKGRQDSINNLQDRIKQIKDKAGI